MKPDANSPPVWPVILSGGAGARLWPLSRAALPKQLLPLAGPLTMIQATAARASDPARFHAPVVVAGADHGALIAEGLAATGQPPQAIILEPVGRNTAAAVALAARHLAGLDPDAIMLVMPSDHVIRDTAAFDRAVAAALPLAQGGWLVTFGIAPTGPETGYGYIQTDEPLDGGAYRVARFVEKPDLATAKGYLASGDYAWNSGIFLFGAQRILDALTAHVPAIERAATAALAAATHGNNGIAPSRHVFSDCPSDSIDYAVMERDARVAVVPVSMGWSDVGSWSSLKAISDTDESGNSVSGDVVAVDSANCLLRSEGPLLAAVGLDNIAVVATGDAVLVAALDRAQDVKRVVDQLAASGRREHLDAPRIVHAWGVERVLLRAPALTLTELTIEPGAESSERDADELRLAEGSATMDGAAMKSGEAVRPGKPGRIANPGPAAARIVETRFPR